jgi:hypothetical protein
MSIEDSIKAAVDEGRHGVAPDEALRQLRSEIHASIIEAHRQLAPGRRWSVNEVRLLDILDHWLSTLPNKKGP